MVYGMGICLMISVSGCVVHTANVAPSPTVGNEINAAKYANGSAADAKKAENAPAWWKSFQDRKLNSVIEESLAHNPDVSAVGRRIEQANARLVQAGASLFPRVDGEGRFDRSWNDNGSGGNSSSLGVLVDWELDVWGRLRSGQSARRNEVAVAEHDWHNARLFLSGVVAETWFSLAEQQAQLALVNDQIELNRTLLELIQLRFGQGQGSAVDVLQQQEQLKSTEALIPDIEALIEEFELAITALTGHVPGKKRFPSPGALQSPPPLPKTGVPADLLYLRPDLRAQRSKIVALDHEVGEAIADCLPRFTIGGSAALSGSPTPERLVGDAIAGAVGPIFDAGSRKAEVKLRRSRVQEEVDIYTAGFIDAVREVETALSRETKIAERIRRQESQLETARKLLVEAQNRNRLGASDYLPVADAVSRVQELERDVLTSNREVLSARVALHRALGGPMPETKKH